MNIKGFDKDLKCRGFQFEIGKEYDTGAGRKELRLCTNTVFHYCKDIKHVHNYYSCDSDNRFCEIEVLGKEVGDGEKFGSNRIKIIREITGEELNILLGKANENTGLFNSGNGNSGRCNSGDDNSGDFNSGNHNSGNDNSGYYNSGDGNSGDFNSGNHNSGDYNSGYYNSGDGNSGNHNSGNGNSGRYNSGDGNSGDFNSGNHNSGDGNSGDFNSGDRSSGDFNSGNHNSGDYNSGDFNKCNYSSGFFCTEEPRAVIFNKETDMIVSEFRRSKYYYALRSAPFMLTEWVKYSDEEMKDNASKTNIGGYLKKYTYKEACKNWWNKLTKESKSIIQEIPNFDKSIFEEITGIKL